MYFEASYADGRLNQVRLGAGCDFDAVVTWSLDLLEQSDGRFLTFDRDAGIITASIEDGRARYRVFGKADHLDRSGAQDEVLTELISVERSCAVCKTVNGHQWYCTHAT